MLTTRTETALITAPRIEPGLRILIAEDHIDCAMSMAILLRLLGHHIEITTTGLAALKKAQLEKPDVLLLDLGLPEMSGYEVARQLSANRPGKTPLIIAVTGYGEEADRRRSQEAGTDLHLVKPVDPRQLLTVLENFERMLNQFKEAVGEQRHWVNWLGNLAEGQGNEAFSRLQPRPNEQDCSGETWDVVWHPLRLSQVGVNRRLAQMDAPRILVVLLDDEQIVAASLCKRLQTLGYDIAATVSSGEEAVEVAGRLQPDLVLMDMQTVGEMERMAAAAARIHNQFRIPVVYLTADSSQEIFDRAKVTIPCDYILKSSEGRELQLVIEMALDRHKLERTLRERERLFASTLKSIGDGVVATDKEGKVHFINRQGELMTGWQAREALGRRVEAVVPLVHAETRQAVEVPLLKALRMGVNVPMSNHVVLIARNKSERPIDDCATLIRDDDGTVLGGVMVFRDVSVGVQTDVTDRRKLETEYQQAQKMEAVGRLAGGVAHHFNNLLTIINGYSLVLPAMLHNHEKAVELLGEIHKAGKRAAGLTQQLLAYSRKQIHQPKVLNLNEVVTNTLKMLRRVIGENVELTTALAPNLHRVKADPSQLEQVLMTLCVNSRDAMPMGGKITIETKNVDFEAGMAAGMFEVVPGSYVLLALTDTGVGMDEETKQHLFEPFFTTKEANGGTGLGLATVYGIVKQSDGYVQVDSERDQGCTFKIYLPNNVEESARAKEANLETPPIQGAGETILLAEDEAPVRMLVHYLLRQSGYNVLIAANGSEALELAAKHQGPIDLLVTDVVMPRISGPQLAVAIRLAHPGIRVLYLSGSTKDAVFRHGILESEAAFLQKPFSIHLFTKTIRDILDSKR